MLRVFFSVRSSSSYSCQASSMSSTLLQRIITPPNTAKSRPGILRIIRSPTSGVRNPCVQCQLLLIPHESSNQLSSPTGACRPVRAATACDVAALNRVTLRLLSHFHETTANNLSFDRAITCSVRLRHGCRPASVPTSIHRMFSTPPWFSMVKAMRARVALLCTSSTALASFISGNANWMPQRMVRRVCSGPFLGRGDWCWRLLYSRGVGPCSASVKASTGGPRPG